jgi:hypothetical protein
LPEVHLIVSRFNALGGISSERDGMPVNLGGFFIVSRHVVVVAVPSARSP